MDQVVVTSGNGRISLLTRGEDRLWAAQEIRAAGAWPSWRPGREEIAFSASSAERGSVVDLVDNLEGFRTNGSFSQGEELTAIAPRVPHYVMWSPDGSILSVVSRADETLGMVCFRAEGGAFGAEVTGAPIFSSWSADSKLIVVHAGPRVLLVEPLTGDVVRTISEGAVGFRAPAVSASGRIIYAEPRDGALRVMQTSTSNDGSSELAEFGSGAVLAFRPGNEDLMVGVASGAETGALSELWMIPMDGSRRRISRGPFIAYCWSPRGDRLALVVPSQSGDGRHYVRVIDDEGSELCASEAFVPSQEFRIWLAFFDQYSQSHGIWDAAGETLLLAGRLVDDAVHSSLGDAVGDKVFAWRAARNEPLEMVALGVSGFFSRADSMLTNPER